MINDLALIMPAAGRGSRFAKYGINEPKPLVELNGKPFFWWAVESVRRVVKLRELVFVVLEDHVNDFSIDKKIKLYYPEAKIIAIPDVTSGAAETAKIGLATLQTTGPVAINDCDHAFIGHSLPKNLKSLRSDIDASLLCFRSADPAYSYIKFNSQHEIVGTVEKQAVSPFAIAGCYLFADAGRFNEFLELYKKVCPYNELFISGIFNLLAQNHLRINMVELDHHCSFGTPDELNKISQEIFAPFLEWK
jgi:dTDP-glucose pyrophosphorylase